MSLQQYSSIKKKKSFIYEENKNKLFKNSIFSEQLIHSSFFHLENENFKNYWNKLSKDLYLYPNLFCITRDSILFFWDSEKIRVINLKELKTNIDYKYKVFIYLFIKINNIF